MTGEFLGSDEERELRGLWLSRLMFGGLVRAELGGGYVETRTYEEFLAAHAPSGPAAGPTTSKETR